MDYMFVMERERDKEVRRERMTFFVTNGDQQLALREAEMRFNALNNISPGETLRPVVLLHLPEERNLAPLSKTQDGTEMFLAIGKLVRDFRKQQSFDL